MAKKPAPKPKSLKLKDLVLDPRLECREKRDAAVVAEYAAAYRDGLELPPIVVYEVDDLYLVTDGWTRVLAAREAGRATLSCDLHAGTFDDAARAAFQANGVHGQRLTNADKRRIVRNGLALWPKLSSREIAKRCGVHHDLVESIRRDVADSATSPTRTDSLGREQPASKSQPEPDLEQNEPDMADPAPDEPTDDATDQPDSEEAGDGGTDAPPAPEAPRSKGQVAVEEADWAEEPLRMIRAANNAIAAKVNAAHPTTVILSAMVCKNLTSAARELADGLPGIVCPKCEGHGCKPCRDQGWLPRREVKASK